MAARKAVPGAGSTAPTYVNIRKWRRFCNRTYKNQFYVAGDPYDGPVTPILLDPKGPDGKGPVIAEAITPPGAGGAPVPDPPTASAADGSSEEN